MEAETRQVAEAMQAENHSLWRAFQAKQSAPLTAQVTQVTLAPSSGVPMLRETLPLTGHQ